MCTIIAVSKFFLGSEKKVKDHMANNFMTQTKKNYTFVPEFKNEMKWISLINIQLLDPFSISTALFYLFLPLMDFSVS